MRARATVRAVALLVAAALLSALPGRAAADDVPTARERYRQGLAAYGLGHYAEAARAYEDAFAASPDSALLFNAAQAHRLAGHKRRAYELYRSYLRLFPDVPNRAEVERRVVDLEGAADSEPPMTGVIAPPVARAATERVPAAREHRRALVLGLSIGGGVLVAGLGLGLGLGFGLLSTSAPHASIGSVELK